MILLAAVVGAGLGASVWLVVSGLRPTTASRPAISEANRWRTVLAGAAGRVDGRRVAYAAGAALAALVLVRWPVAVAAAAVAGWLVPLPGQRAARRQAEARTEAIAQWCEMLRDAAGTARGIEGVLAATAVSAPAPIRAEVERMARRLQHEPLDIVLDGLADDLAHPMGDLVVTALRVAARAGSRRVALVLGSLAAAAHREASMRLRVEVARERPRSTMRLVALIVAGFLAGLVVFAGEYLAPYGTVTGQVVLVGIGFYWALGFWWMARMGRVEEVERFLAPAGSSTVPGPAAAGSNGRRGGAL